MSADLWSLNGRIIRTGAFLWTSRFTNLLLISRLNESSYGGINELLWVLQFQEDSSQVVTFFSKYIRMYFLKNVKWFVVYKVKCDLCDADYVGYTRRHLFQRIDEHKQAQLLENTCVTLTIRRTKTSLNNSLYWRNVVGNLNAWSTKCFLSRKGNPNWTLNQTQ